VVRADTRRTLPRTEDAASLVLVAAVLTSSPAEFPKTCAAVAGSSSAFSTSAEVRELALLEMKISEAKETATGLPELPKEITMRVLRMKKIIN
jgi:hypothetical protein